MALVWESTYKQKFGEHKRLKTPLKCLIRHYFWVMHHNYVGYLLVEENRFHGSGMLSEAVPPTIGCRELAGHAGFMGSTHATFRVPE